MPHSTADHRATIATNPAVENFMRFLPFRAPAGAHGFLGTGGA
jgi:hypothetical protein